MRKKTKAEDVQYGPLYPSINEKGEGTGQEASTIVPKERPRVKPPINNLLAAVQWTQQEEEKFAELAPVLRQREQKRLLHNRQTEQKNGSIWNLSIPQIA